MHFRILKMIATGCFLAALECTKNRFRPSLCPGPHWAGGAYRAPPEPSSWFKGATSKGRGRERRKAETPLHQFLPTSLKLFMCTSPTRLNLALTLAPQPTQLEFRVTSVGCMSDLQQDCSGG